MLIMTPILLSACSGCNPVKPEDPCADRPIYEPYKIDVPQRPTLASSNLQYADAPGVTVRVVESDFSLLVEYAQKLENIVKALPQDVVVPKK